MAGRYEQNPTAPVRRRRKRRPKWQRMLRKYWPPIRFGLLIIAAILLIVLAVNGIIGLFTSDPSDETTGQSTSGSTGSPVESSAEQASTTTPPETTGPDPSGTTPPETTAPPVTTTPPETAAPVADNILGVDLTTGAVPDSWFDNVLFIGDSRTVGLREYCRSGNAEYFCDVGMSVFNYKDKALSDKNFSNKSLKSLLSGKTYDKIFISLGINECGYPASTLIKAYQELVDMVRQAQPNAKIILQGIMAVGSSKAASASYFAPSIIQSINDRIQEISDGTSVFYIDVNEYFTDSSGCLKSELSGDGVHLYAKYNELWADWIAFAVGKLNI